LSEIAKTIRFPESELIINEDGSVYHLNLKPEHISDTIITVGDPGRVYKVSQYFDDIEFEMNKREFITHIGKYKGKRITVISSGVGTDNVEIVLTELDILASIDLKTRFEKPDKEKKKLKIIRIGTSGSLQEDIPLGTHLVSNYAVGLDSLMNFYTLQQSAFETEICENLKNKIGLRFTPYCTQGSAMLQKQFAHDMVVGNTITSPGFYAAQGRKLRLELPMPHLIRDLNYFHQNDFWFTNFEMETAGYYAMGRMMNHEILSVNAIIANRITNKFSKDPEKVIDSLIKKILDRV
jgi:uridine phosphorylase